MGRKNNSERTGNRKNLNGCQMINQKFTNLSFNFKD